MWDVWFLCQIHYRTIEHPWIINEIAIKSKSKPKIPTEYLIFKAFHSHFNNGALLKHQLSPEIAKLVHSRKLKFSQNLILKILCHNINV